MYIRQPLLHLLVYFILQGHCLVYEIPDKRLSVFNGQSGQREMINRAYNVAKN